MTMILKEEGNRRLPFDEDRLRKFISRVTTLKEGKMIDKVIRSIKTHEEFQAESITNLLIKTILENIDEANAHLSFDASKIYLETLYKKASRNRSYDKDDKYGNFYGLVKVLASKGIYSKDILEKYSKEEIKELSTIIAPERDLLFDYTGLQLLASRYCVKDFNGDVYELPQERFLVISMVLMQDEDPKYRDSLVREAYWAMSNLYMTVATPTLANAGLNFGQLSSCFIDTVEDSLVEIYNSNTDVARLSKDGGGIGVYMGKVRAEGSDIKGFPNASSGVIPWIKQLNGTAVSVDQLGRRKGAIAIYLDIWHRDTPAFLDIKLNNGDERKKAHDIFTGVCIPDIFMETVEKRGDWYLFCPHEIRTVMGYSLEDYYDEFDGAGSFRDRYEECVRDNRLTKTKVPAISLMARILKAQLETGTPYMFYRDEVNRKNPNKHKGMIYCSNLCTEITQNQSPTIQFEEYIEDEDIIVTKKKAGDFVVCNLSSINLGRSVTDDVLERVIPIQTRMLDNVIDLNTIDVKQATITNHRYRAIGFGTFGWHHLLALKGIYWESQEAVDYADELYEKLNYLLVKASNDLAIEKSPYKFYAGSDWNTGAYFELRDYHNGNSKLDWDTLKKRVMEYGMRNGWCFAVAPNGATSVIHNSTASTDPVFKPFFYEEKKNYRLPVVAPDLNWKTFEFYPPMAHGIDQFWSVRQNAARQRHVDQSISFNIYVPNNINAKVLLRLHLEAWKLKMKTTYYVRSTSSEIEECEWCQS